MPVDPCGLYRSVSGYRCAVHTPVQDCNHGHVLFPPLPGLCGPSVLPHEEKQQTPDSGQNKVSRLQRRKTEAQQEEPDSFCLRDHQASCL